MKNVLFVVCLIFSIQGYAQLNLNFDEIGSSFQLSFNSGYVCKSEPAFSKAPTLGYGQSEGLAKANAIGNCMSETGNAKMHCDDLECEKISFNGGKPKVEVTMKNGKIGVFFSLGSNYTCVVDNAFNKGLFYAEAPTQLEAEVYAQRVCMGQTGNARMHCDDIQSCEQTSGLSVQTDDLGSKVKKVLDLFN
jgi:hypothetical protein